MADGTALFEFALVSEVEKICRTNLLWDEGRKVECSMLDALDGL